ncbi:hypothetical protein C8R45DRAFT_943552 [Mycena sanguinolenta]|nr:hypothetical protein C8R45DRAFT_943552 [Mycena sanguinolenta]
MAASSTVARISLYCIHFGSCPEPSFGNLAICQIWLASLLTEGGVRRRLEFAFIQLTVGGDSRASNRPARQTDGSRNGRFYVTGEGTRPSADFLSIPLGNIDLRNEIGVDTARGVMRRDSERRSVRRMYSARVVGQGNNAEEEWKRDLDCHSRLRASSSEIHAAVFHDDLVLFSQFLKSFQHFPVLTAYIMACMVWSASIVSMNQAESPADRRLASAPCAIECTRLFCIHSVNETPGRLSMDFDILEHDDPYNIQFWASKRPPPSKSILDLRDPP